MGHDIVKVRKFQLAGGGKIRGMENNIVNLALRGKASAAVSVFRHCIDAVKSAARVRRRRESRRSFPARNQDHTR